MGSELLAFTQQILGEVQARPVQEEEMWEVETDAQEDHGASESARDRVKRVLPSGMLPAEPLPATSLLPAEPLKTVPLAQAEPPPRRPQLQAELLLATPQATRYPRSVRSATISEAQTITRRLPRRRQTPERPLLTYTSRPLSSLSADFTICTGSSLLVWYEHAPRVRMFSWAGCKLKGKA